jgi:signal peptidase I
VEKVYRFVGWTVLVLGGIVLVARALALRWWQVPLTDAELAASIGPSLRGGDWVLLWRLTRPGLGDLVLCPDPDDAANVVIGRIIAQAHDTVTIHGEDVLVNGKRFNIEYNCTEQAFRLVDPDSLKEVEVNCDMEEVGEKLHMRGYASDGKSRRKYEQQVGSGKVFLMSDNRAYPFDSRHYGTVERTSCSETVFFRLVSKDGFFDVPNRLTYIR